MFFDYGLTGRDPLRLVETIGFRRKAPIAVSGASIEGNEPYWRCRGKVMQKKGTTGNPAE